MHNIHDQLVSHLQPDSENLDQNISTWFLAVWLILNPPYPCIICDTMIPGVRLISSIDVYRYNFQLSASQSTPCWYMALPPSHASQTCEEPQKPHSLGYLVHFHNSSLKWLVNCDVWRPDNDLTRWITKRVPQTLLLY